jgi:hypothetical protein
MDMKAAVRNGVIGLRLTQEAAMAIASKAVKLSFPSPPPIVPQHYNFPFLHSFA